MISRILLFVACGALLSTSQAEAQLFQRLRAQPQPQRYVPNYPQNGYQGRLTAAQPRRPVYVRRADGSVVRYYPNSNPQQPGQIRNFRQPKQNASRRGQPNQIANSNTRSVQGQLKAVPPTPANVAPVGVSVLKRTNQKTAVASISPATSMPEASVAGVTADPVSSIPVSQSITNPVPQGLSLSVANDDVVPASADVPVKSMPEKPQTFSVLEYIE